MTKHATTSDRPLAASWRQTLGIAGVVWLGMGAVVAFGHGLLGSGGALSFYGVAIATIFSVISIFDHLGRR